jgi:hypothetical protein
MHTHLIPVSPGLLYLETTGRVANSEHWLLGILIRKQCGRMPYPSLEEQRALAKELLKTPETCLAWEPIPSRFSGDWQVDVTHVAEDYGEDRWPGENLTIALAAYYEFTDTKLGPASTHHHEVGAWRIDFTGCGAYRTRVINYVGAAPLTRPDTASAFWEIAGSHYLVKSGAWAAYFPREFHHYVIVSGIHTVHEVIATGWRCTPLPPEWAKTFNGPMPSWPPIEA